MPVRVTGHTPDGPRAGHQVDLPVAGPHPEIDPDVRRDRGKPGGQHQHLPHRDVEVEESPARTALAAARACRIDVQPQRHAGVGIARNRRRGRGPDADLRLGQDLLGDVRTSVVCLDQELPGVGDGRERADRSVRLTQVSRRARARSAANWRTAGAPR